METCLLTATILSALFLSPWFLGFFTLCFAALLLDQPASATIGTFLPLIVLFLALPGAAYVAGIFLDEYCEIKWKGPIALLALSLGTNFLFSHSFLYQALESVHAAHTAVGNSTLLLSSISAVSGAAGLMALTYMFVTLCFELPLAWLLGGSPYRLPFRAFRPLLILFAFSLGFHLVAALFIRELGGLYQ